MTETVWLKALNLLKENGRTTGVPKSFKGCYCVGGAISEAITGDPNDMEHEEERPEVDAALHRFADHVGVDKTYTWDGEIFNPSGYDRVYPWNDSLSRTDEEVYKALQELHDIEVGSR